MWSTCPKGKERFWGFFGPIGLKQKWIELVHKKLRIFPYGQYIVRIDSSLAFQTYDKCDADSRVYEKCAKM